jgi:hypothetical protein
MDVGRREVVAWIRQTVRDARVADERERLPQPDLPQEAQRDRIVVDRQERCRRRISGYFFWMAKVERIVAAAPAERGDERKRLDGLSSPRFYGALGVTAR